MRPMRALLVAAAVAAAGPAGAAETPAPAAAPVEPGVFFPETFTLDNGLQVVVVSNHRVPVVTHMLWYKVGAADEPRGKSGLAHLLEHLMFKGTDELAPGEFSRIVKRHGGEDNAFTSWDYTGYYQNVAKDRLELVMRMEADRMTDLQFTDDVVEPEIAVVLEERRRRIENDPGSRLGEAMMAALFVHHPYGTPIIGWAHEIAGLTREDALAFYRNWYNPANAVLVIAGDVTAAEVRPLAEKYYGAIPVRPLPPRERVSEPTLQVERRVVLRDPEVRQPALRRAYLAPSYNTGPPGRAYALQVLSEILGGPTGRLYRSLVVEQRLAVSAAARYSASSYDLSTFGFSLSPAPGHSLEALEAALSAEIAKVLDDGVSAEEVATAKTRLKRDAIFARDSLSGPAWALGSALATGRSVEEVEAWPVRIDAVTVAEVNAAAREVLGQTGFVSGYLLPTVPQQAEVVP